MITMTGDAFPFAHFESTNYLTWSFDEGYYGPLHRHRMSVSAWNDGDNLPPSLRSEG